MVIGRFTGSAELQNEASFIVGSKETDATRGGRWP